MAKQRPPKDKKTAHHQRECVAVDKSLIVYVMYLRVTQQIHRLPDKRLVKNGAMEMESVGADLEPTVRSVQ